LNALGDAYTYTQNGNQITFRDDVGKISIVLTRSGSSPSIVTSNTTKNPSTQPATLQITTLKTETMTPVLNPGSQSVNSLKAT
jgi:hypothetical protein